MEEKEKYEAGPGPISIAEATDRWAEVWPDLPDGLKEEILMAIGQASTCWTELPDQGVFLSEQATQIGRLLAWAIVETFGRGA